MSWSLYMFTKATHKHHIHTFIYTQMHPPPSSFQPQLLYAWCNLVGHSVVLLEKRACCPAAEGADSVQLLALAGPTLLSALGAIPLQ